MPLKIVGVGLGRTGTLSLKLALEQLGFGPCYHMAELIVDSTRAPLWVRAADGQADWEAVFAGYTATVDYPGCSFWRELTSFYPAAKVLLSVREPDKWFESTQATIFGDAMNKRLSESPLKGFFDKTVYKEFGDRIHDREFMIAAFKRHNMEVVRTIPSDRLLVYEAVQGWPPLCQFLGVPVPATAFPRVNSREEHEQMRASSPQGAGDPALSLEAMRERIRERLAQMPGEGRQTKSTH